MSLAPFHRYHLNDACVTQVPDGLHAFHHERIFNAYMVVYALQDTMAMAAPTCSQLSSMPTVGLLVFFFLLYHGGLHTRSSGMESCRLSPLPVTLTHPVSLSWYCTTSAQESWTVFELV